MLRTPTKGPGGKEDGAEDKGKNPTTSTDFGGRGVDESGVRLVQDGVQDEEREIKGSEMEQDDHSYSMTGERERKGKRQASNSPQREAAAKRSAVDQDVQKDEELKEILGMVGKLIENLSELGKAQNTKVEIKNVAKSLPYKFTRLKRAIEGKDRSVAEVNKVAEDTIEALREELEDCREKQAELLKQNRELKEKLNSVSGAAVSPDGAQGCVKCALDANNRRELAEAKKAGEIEEKLSKEMTLEEMAEVVREEWPDRVLRHLTRIPADFVEPREVRAMLFTKGSGLDENIVDRLVTQFPSIAGVKALSIGSVAVLRAGDSLELLGVEEGPTATQRHMVVGVVGPGDRERTEPNLAVYRAVVTKAIELAGGKATPLVHITKDRRVRAALQALELCGRKGGSGSLEVCSGAASGPGDAANGAGLGTRGTIRVKVGEGEGKTFAAALRGVRNQLDTAGSGVEVKGISRSKEGDLILRINENRAGAGKELAAVIGSSTKMQADCRNSSVPQTVALWGVDPMLDERGVERAIREALSVPDATAIRATEPRLGRAEVWYALVTAPAPIARALRAHTTIKLGSRWCRPEEWIRLPNCYNCQRPGHKAVDCKETRREGKVCHRCGGSDHLVRDCNAQVAKCHVCDVEGHRADGMSCPVYRRLVEQMRASRNSNAQGNRDGHGDASSQRIDLPGNSNDKGKQAGAPADSSKGGPSQPGAKDNKGKRKKAGRKGRTTTVTDGEGGADWTFVGTAVEGK